MCMMDNGEVVFLSGSSEDIMMYGMLLAYLSD